VSQVVRILVFVPGLNFHTGSNPWWNNFNSSDHYNSKLEKIE